MLLVNNYIKTNGILMKITLLILLLNKKVSKMFYCIHSSYFAIIKSILNFLENSKFKGGP